MSDEILEDLPRAIDNVDIPPVNPGMLRPHGRGQEVVPRLAHSFPARPLRLEAVAVLDALAQLKAKILLDNGCTAEGDFIRPLLDTVELGGEDGEGVVGGVADEEGQVDQVMRVGQLGDQFKILGQKVLGVFQRSQDEDALFVCDGLGGGLDWIEVDVLDGRRVDL